MNKLAYANEASRTRGQHIIGSSSIDPTMVQSNSLGWEALAFTSGANNTNYYDFDGQHNAMNNLTCATTKWQPLGLEVNRQQLVLL